MPVTIGDNIAALRAVRALEASTTDVSRVFERLGSGQRINRPSDDAAGLSVAADLNAKTRLYSTAQRNISDALSMLRIVEGTLEQQSTILQRLSELAQQSANGVFSSVQRKTMNREYQQLLKEFGRLGDATSFNDLKLLRGSRSDGVREFQVQAGVTGASTAQLAITSADTATLSGTVNRDTIEVST